MRFEELVVDGLDMFRYEFTASRYADFAAHVGSWRGDVLALPALAVPTRTVDELLSALTPPVAAQAPDAVDRQHLFDEWTAALAVPLSARVDRVEICARRDGDETQLLLIESPEPLPIGEDVTFRLWQLDGSGNATEVTTAALLDGSQCRALIVPHTSSPNAAMALPPGRYRVDFTINRSRLRAAAPDSDSQLRQQVSIDLEL